MAVSRDTPSPDARALHELADERHRDPAAVLAQAQQVLADRGAPADARAVAAWVAGLALHEQGRLGAARPQFRTAIRRAARLGDRHTEALARAGLAITLVSTGDAAGAHREIDAAGAVAPPSARARVRFLAGLVLQRSGRLDEAQSEYDGALRGLQRGGDDATVARLLLNRGALRAYQGHLDGALRDLVRAEQLAGQLDLPVLEAMAAHNLGFAHGRRGDVHAALDAFDRAELSYSSLDSPARLVAVLDSDRCELLLGAGLIREACRSADAAVRALTPAGDVAHLAEARLLAAQAHLADGDHERARTMAEDTAAAFRAARRRPWAAFADYVAVEAEMAALDDGAPRADRLVTRCRRIARELDAQGWAQEAAHVRTFLGRICLAEGRPALVARELHDSPAARRTGTVEQRVHAWHAAALVRLAGGDTAGAKRALRQGLKLVEAHRASLAATELRAGVAVRGAALATLGLDLAVRDGRPLHVLDWAEQWRAGALRTKPAVPPDDAGLVAALTELRALQADARQSAFAGRPDAGLRTRIARAEAAVAARTRRQAAGGVTAEAARFDAAALRRDLTGRRFVEYVAAGRDLHAVTVVGGRARLHHLGDRAVIEQEVRYLRFALRGVLGGRGGADGFAADARRLESLILPAALAGSDDPVVVVPTGVLHGVPWRGLPALAGHDVTVAPSAALWQRPVPGGPPRRRQVVLVAGPDLPAAPGEVARLAAIHPGATVLEGREATVAAVLGAVEGADLVHLSVHGDFRADSPLFSSLRLADGDLTIYDLERLRSVPARFVLAACDAAVAEVRTGDELLGTAAALIGLGAGCVVAPVAPVPDGPTTELMVRLHTRLRAGESPSAALAGASTPDAVAGSFVCIGSLSG